MKLAGGEALFTISIPQLAIQPFDPGVAVPGAPVSAGLGMQKSCVVPHWPQTLQQALRGHEFRSARVDMSAGLLVPGTCGPQTALETGAGIGGEPVERQMLPPTIR
jgi:hypothetical protein